MDKRYFTIVALIIAALIGTSARAQELADTGFEANALNGSSITVVYSTKRPMTITGYNLFLSMSPNAGASLPLWSGSLAEVLFFITVTGAPEISDFGAGVITDNSSGKTQQLHGGGVPVNYQFAQAILKANVSVGSLSSVNTPLHASGLNISLPAGATITFYAGHAGWGPMDFEMQGGFVYK